MKAPTGTGSSVGVGSNSDILGAGRGSPSEAHRTPEDDQHMTDGDETPRRKTQEDEIRDDEGEDEEKTRPSIRKRYLA